MAGDDGRRPHAELGAVSGTRLPRTVNRKVHGSNPCSGAISSSNMTMARGGIQIPSLSTDSISMLLARCRQVGR